MKSANIAKNKLNNTLDQYQQNKKNQDEHKGEAKNYSDCQFREEGEFFADFIKLMGRVLLSIHMQCFMQKWQTVSGLL